MALELQTVEVNGQKYAVLHEGKPLYKDSVDGKEIPFDAESARVTAATLNLEAAKNRQTLKEQREALEKFQAVGANPDEIAAFRKTLEEYGGIDGLTELKKKGAVDVEAVKKSLTEAAEARYKQTVEQYEGKVKELSTSLSDKDGQIYKLMVSGQLATSKFVSDKLTLPPDIVEATFGKHFKIEDGNVVAYIGDDKILSRERMGEPAGIDEALAVIVDKYPMKDRIMKAPGGGSGAMGGGSGGSGGTKEISRQQFQSMNPAAQMAHIKGGGTVTD